MASFILVTGGVSLFNNFIRDNDFNVAAMCQVEMDQYLQAAMHCQLSIHHPNLTDEQDHLFETTYEPALSDNSMSALQYSEMYCKYAEFTKGFNLYIASLINNNLLNRYTDVDRKGDEIYVFYTRM